MQNLLLLIEVSCFAPMVLNAVPYKMFLEKLKLQDNYFLNCCLCTSTWIASVLALFGVIDYEAIPLVAVLSELIDRKINDF